MERKPKRRTRERILETSLKLFNDFGEPNVTTTIIADEMNISPGNLYYHFANKDEIVNSIFHDFEKEMDEILLTPLKREPNVEDVWLFLHVVFELMWKFRFVYRDLNDILSKNRIVETHFKRLLEDAIKIARRLGKGMRDTGELVADDRELDALAKNMVQAATYWHSFEYVLNPRKPLDANALSRGVYQVMAMVAPFLQGKSKALLDRLSQEYLNH